MPVTVSQLHADDPRWSAFVEARPDANVFHHASWIGLLADCYRLQPLTLAAFDGAEIRGVLPAMILRSPLRPGRIVALPFSDYSPPLGDGAATDALVDHLDICRKEFGCRTALTHHEYAPAAGRWPGPASYLHTTELDDDADRLLSRMHRTRVRQPIEQARRAGVIVTAGEAWEDVAAFYRLQVETRRRHGVPVQPLRFFRLLHERLIARGLGHVVLARVGGEVVAGAVMLGAGKRLLYKFGASTAAAAPCHANHLLLWETMCAGARAGVRTFDWGRTDEHHASLREFKLAWGSSERHVRWMILADREPAARAASRGNAARMAGALIRHSPRWVTRALGEILYRHFA